MSDPFRDYILDQLAGVYAGRKWLLCSDVLAGLTGTVADLASLGATDVFCLALSPGTGNLPETPHALLGRERAETLMDSVRQALHGLAHVSDDVRKQVDAWDPQGEARSIGPVWDDGAPVAGRPKFAERLAHWQALEDKTIIDPIWDKIGVARAPSSIVPLDDAQTTTRSLDWGSGVVWVGDNRDGWHGGAELLRWVRTEREANEAATFLGQHCDQVRVMPFLEGIPCSIHGIVMSGGIVAVRPCEMIVLRKPGSSTLQYARAGTFWDPPPAQRQVMIDAARQTGTYLRDVQGYRGVFTIDGVMTRRGFLPTELNPRFGGALATVARGTRLPLLLLHLAIVDGLELPAAELEHQLVAAADAHRYASGMAMIGHAVEPRQAHLQLVGQEASDPNAWTFVDEDDSDAEISLGPSGLGGYLNINLNPDTTPTGPSSAPRIAGILMHLDAAWDLGLGPLAPAEEAHLD